MRKHASKENDRCRGHNQRESPNENKEKVIQARTTLDFELVITFKY